MLLIDAPRGGVNRLSREHPLSLDDAGAKPERLGTRLERGLVTLLLVAMILLPAASTVARRVLGRDLPGSSVLAQHITLWVGFLGALLATATGRHLALSTLNLVPQGWPRRAASFFTQAVSAAVCALLAWASTELVQSEWNGFGRVAFGIRTAWSELVMPVGFAAMALRFAWIAGNGDAGFARRWGLRAGAATIAVGAFLLAGMAPSQPLVTALLLVMLAAFLLGAPVFIVMSGLAMALFFRGSVESGQLPGGDRGGPHRDLQPRLLRDPPRDPPPHRGRLRPRRGRRRAAAGPRLQGALRVDAGRDRNHGDLRLRALHHVHRRVGRHHPRPRRAPPAHAPRGEIPGGLLGRPRHRRRLPRPPLPALAPGDPLRGGGRGRDRRPLHRRPRPGPADDRPRRRLRRGGRRPGRRAPPAVRPQEALAALWDAKWDLGLPTLVVVAVGTGFATVVEAAALAAAYSLMVELLVFRSIHPARDLPRVLVHAAALVGSVLILLGSALGLTSWFVDAEVPTRLVEWMTAHVHSSPALFLLMLNAVLLVLGSVLEIYSAIVVLAPLVAPLGEAYGIDAIHLGVVFLANLELGFLFPPMGLNLFLSASRFGKPLPWVYRKAFPFLLIMAAGVLAITYLPGSPTAWSRARREVAVAATTPHARGPPLAQGEQREGHRVRAHHVDGVVQVREEHRGHHEHVRRRGRARAAAAQRQA